MRREDRKRWRQIGDRVYEQRCRLGLSQTAAVERCDIHRPDFVGRTLDVHWFGRVEDGARARLEPWELRVLAEGLDLDFDELLALSEGRG